MDVEVELFTALRSVTTASYSGGAMTIIVVSFSRPIARQIMG
jgi:hypothetical protein